MIVYTRYTTFFQLNATGLIEYMTLGHLPLDCRASVFPLQNSDEKTSFIS